MTLDEQIARPDYLYGISITNPPYVGRNHIIGTKEDAQALVDMVNKHIEENKLIARLLTGQELPKASLSETKVIYFIREIGKEDSLLDAPKIIESENTTLTAKLKTAEGALEVYADFPATSAPYQEIMKKVQWYEVIDAGGTAQEALAQIRGTK